MKEDKICLSKTVAFVAVVAFILVGVVVFTNYVNTQSTATGTRASGEKMATCQKMANWVAYSWTGSTGLADATTNNTCVKFTGNFLGENTVHRQPNGGVVTRNATSWADGAGTPAIVAAEVSNLPYCQLSTATTNCYNPVSATALSALATTCKALEGKAAYSWKSNPASATDNMCVAWTGSVYDENRVLPVPNSQNGGASTIITPGDLKCWYGPAVSCASLTPAPGSASRQATVAKCDARKGEIAYSWASSGDPTPAEMCVTYTGRVFDYGSLSHTVPNGSKVTAGSAVDTQCALSDATRCINVQPTVAQANKDTIKADCTALAGEVAYTWNGDGTTGSGKDNLCVTYTGGVYSYDENVARNTVPLSGTATAQASENRKCSLSAQKSCLRPWVCNTGSCSQSGTYLTNEALNAGIADNYVSEANCKTACF